MKCIDIANYISQKLLQQDFIIHKYEAYSTCSIYLKLDYGVLNSIRISDHNGYEHLNYKYVILQNCYKIGWHKTKFGYWQYQCSANIQDIDNLINIIIANRQYKMSYYNYPKLLQQYKNESESSKIGFWKDAKEVKLDDCTRITKTNN